MKTATQARAEQVAAKLAESPRFVAFEWDILIGILVELVPVIVGCFRPASGTEARRYVSRRWNAARADGLYGGYTRRLVATVSAEAARLAREQGAALDRFQAHELALATLDDVRTGDVEQVSLILEEHPS